MYNGYRVIVCIPFGRRKFTDILLRYLVREYSIIDEIRFWLNTEDKLDIEWAEKKSVEYKKINLDYTVLDKGLCEYSTPGVSRFYYNCSEDKCVYLKIDDDIVWLSQEFVKNIVNFRIKNPEYFLVSANIINNAICDYIHKKNGLLPFYPEITYCPFDHKAWADPIFAEEKHRIFLSNLWHEDMSPYKFDKHVLKQNRFCINCICWFGKWPEFNGNLSQKTFDYICGDKGVTDDEEELTCSFTKINKAYNCICGNAICSHFSFWTQIEHMLTTDILEDYKDTCRDLGLYNE